jgi:hypothetical protein
VIQEDRVINEYFSTIGAATFAIGICFYIDATSGDLTERSKEGSSNKGQGKDPFILCLQDADLVIGHRL